MRVPIHLGFWSEKLPGRPNSLVCSIFKTWTFLPMLFWDIKNIWKRRSIFKPFSIAVVINMDRHSTKLEPIRCRNKSFILDWNHSALNFPYDHLMLDCDVLVREPRRSLNALHDENSNIVYLLTNWLDYLFCIHHVTDEKQLIIKLIDSPGWAVNLSE